MTNIERAEPDERRWTLTRSHPMTTSLDGPRLALGEEVEVVPADQLRGAVEALREYGDHQSWRCSHPDRYPHDPDCPCGLLSTLARFGGQEGGG